MVVLLKRGGLRAQEKACLSMIIPIKTDRSDNAQVQFDRGDEKDVIAVKDWSTLPLATIENDIAIRRVNCPLVFIWVRFYKEEHWPWLRQHPKLNQI